VTLKAVPLLQAAGIYPTDSKNSPDYLPTQILAKGYAEGHSRKELAAAMNRLMGSAGKLRRGVVGKYPNRSKRYGLVIVEAEPEPPPPETQPDPAQEAAP